MYKIRVILDTKEDVIRTITLKDTINLEELHIAILRSFGFDGREMASFYRTDNKWSQGQEIPLLDMSEFGDSISMNNYILNETLQRVNDKLIYVYDFLRMWTFYVEVIDISKDLHTNLPNTIMSVGKLPEKELTKEFIAEKLDEKLFEDENEDENDDEYYF